MLKNVNAKTVSIYCLVGSLGLCCALWLVFAFNGVGSVPFEQSHEHRHDPVYAPPPNDDKSPIEPSLTQSRMVSGQADGFASDGASTGYAECSLRCESSLSMLEEGLELDDETFQGLEVHIKEIANYLQHDESQRQHYLQMALTTIDGDKRAFLTAIFSHLPYQQKVELAENFVVSDDWRVRADGVTLIADNEIPNASAADALLDVFSNEQHSYVKSSVLNYLEKSSALKGDTETLSRLDAAIYNETDPSVRVAALKAKMQLSDQLHHIVPDALQALRTDQPEFQLAGLIALERVLQHDKAASENGVYIDTSSIQNEFQIIKGLAHYGNDKKRFDRLTKQANVIYSRYFE